jgi:hypothetical protein
MKKTIVFLVLISTALACLAPVAGNVDNSFTNASRTAVITTDILDEDVTKPGQMPTEGPAGAVIWLTTPVPRCVRVTAVEALTLRTGESEHATSLTHLKSGEVVQLLGTGNPDWWMVRRGDLVGYARSSYLEEVPCDFEVK